MLLTRCCSGLYSLFTVVHAQQSSVWVACVQAFYMPATKHLWWGLGIRPIDKRSFGDLLKAKTSVVLVPGGLSECMIMKKGWHISTVHHHLLLILLPLLFFEVKCVMRNMHSVTCGNTVKAADRVWPMLSVC